MARILIDRRKNQIPAAILLILSDQAAGKTRWPSIFIIKPRQHILLLRLLHHSPHDLHELIAQIGSVHSCAAMHVKAAQPHLFKIVHFPRHQLLVQLTVPCPKRSAAEF